MRHKEKENVCAEKSVFWGFFLKLTLEYFITSYKLNAFNLRPCYFNNQ